MELRGVGESAPTRRAQPAETPAPAAHSEPLDRVSLAGPAVRDEAGVHPSNVPQANAETMGDLHKKVGHDEPPEEAAEHFEPGERLQPEVAQKARGLAAQVARQRVLMRDERGGETRMGTAEAEETVRDTRLLADGVVPSMMEGLLNQVHRKEHRNRKDAARLLLIILKAHGAYVYEHCTRLVDLAMSLAREMGEETSEQFEQQIEDGMTYKDVGEVAFFLTRRSARQRDALAAYLAGLDLAQESMLHDLGKIQVPEEVLMKPAPLNEKERAIMERHPVWGAEILEGIPPLHHAIPVTRHHHERWDGHGYPDAVGGEDIPLAARIVSVVDAFDAMVSDRPYRKGLPFAEACDIIREGSGTQFDPRVAQAFLRIADKVWSPERQY
jgi:HD-GYP domain-containing protein (c-di-GMP phosphodiesterase class II)